MNKKALSIIVAATLALVSAGIQAQASDAKPQERQVTLAIASQSLRTALNEWAQQTGNQLIAEVSGDFVTPKIEGAWTPQAALEQLLQGTPLTYEWLNDHVVAIRSRAPPGPPAGANDQGSSRLHLAALDTPQAGSRVVAGMAERGKGSEPPAAEGKLIQEVIVTAQKRSERLEDVPISIAVVGGDDLDRSSFSQVTDILNTVPGVTTTTAFSGAGTQIAVRGVTAAAATFAGSSPIAYYVDSVPFGFVRTAIAPDIVPYDLDRIEVLRGPQGTLYGASALNGVVRVLTKDADLRDLSFKMRTSVSTTEEGGGNYGGDAAVNVPLIDAKLAVRAVVGYQDQSGWIDNLVENNINDAVMRNFRLKINAVPTEKLSIGVSVWQRRDNFGGLAASEDDFTIPRFMPEPSSADLHTYGFKIGYEAAAFSVSSMASFVDYQMLTAVDNGGGSVVTSDLRAQVFSEELVFTSNEHAVWRWTAGAFYRDAKDRTTQGFLYTFDNNRYDPLDNFEDTSESLAFFGEIGRRFANGKWEWAVGLRHFTDDVATQMIVPPLLAGVPLTPIEDSFDSTTPRAVLTWFPREDLAAYASYSEGFRSGFPQTELAETLVPGFPSVEPDRLRNYEIGAKGSLGRRLAFAAAVFYVDWDDVQQVTGVPIPGVDGIANVVVNGDSASGLGAELTLIARPLDALDLRFSVSWNDLTMDEPVVAPASAGGRTLYDKGDRLSQSPEYTAGASAEYSFALGASGYEAQLMAAATYTSEQKTASFAETVAGDDMLISRLRLTIEAPDHWSAALFIDNLGDDRGSPLVLIPELHEYDTRVRPRTVGAQLEYRF